MWRRKKPVQALLFDVGGVLVQTQIQGFLKVGSLVFGCSPKTLEAHLGLLVRELERGEIDSYSLWEEVGQSLAAAGEGTAQDPEKVELVWHKTLEESLVIDQSMLDLCRRLRGVLPMGILSNTIADHAKFLRDLGVYDGFNPCVLSYEVGLRKPEAAIYLLACDLLRTAPENCLFIDDLELNLKAAKSLKMQTHLFRDQETLEKRLGELGILGAPT